MVFRVQDSRVEKSGGRLSTDPCIASVEVSRWKLRPNEAVAAPNTYMAWILGSGVYLDSHLGIGFGIWGSP